MAGLRNRDGWFAVGDLVALFEALRVRPPGNPSQALKGLADDELVTHRKSSRPWSLSPLGRQRAHQLAGELNAASLELELALRPGAELGSARHALIPPGLAPGKWAPGIRRMLEDFDFATNVFCMMRLPDHADDTSYLDPVREVIPAARASLERHGLALHLASDRQIDDDLYGNVAAHMWACQFGVGLFEDRLGRGLNHNMVIEVGSMMITGRRCALLKDVTIAKLPTDFVGQIYKPVDFDDLETVTGALHGWAAKDLGLGRCAECPADVEAVVAV